MCDLTRNNIIDRHCESLRYMLSVTRYYIGRKIFIYDCIICRMIDDDGNTISIQYEPPHTPYDDTLNLNGNPHIQSVDDEHKRGLPVYLNTWSEVMVTGIEIRSGSRDLIITARAPETVTKGYKSPKIQSDV